MQMIKTFSYNFLAILLCMLIFINSAGYVVAFLKMQTDAKREMKEKISSVVASNELVCIRIKKTMASAVCRRDDGEIEYQGGMYDIIKKVDAGNEFILYCLNDRKEENIVRNFKAQFDQNKDGQNQKIMRTAASTALPPVYVKVNFATEPEVEFFSTLNNCLHYISVSPEILTPPPKIFS